MNRRDALQTFALTAGVLTTGSLERLLTLGQSVRMGMPTAARLRLLTAEDARTVGLLAEIILPRTDTPGATDADVTGFIDTMLAGWLEIDEREAFLEGLRQVDVRARRQYGSAFADCNDEQRVALVAEMDAEVAALLQAEGAALADEYVEAADTATPAESHFFYQMKRLTLTGYFTSEPGMRQALGYRAFPGRWQPCVVLQEERR